MPKTASMADVENKPLRDPERRASLIIGEDDPELVQELCAWIAECGYAVVAVADSEIALINAGMRYRPELILTSTRLGGEEAGVRAVRTLQNSYDPAIILATEGEEEQMLGARPTHSVLFDKPYRRAALTVAIEEALALKARSLLVRRLADFAPVGGHWSAGAETHPFDANTPVSGRDGRSRDMLVEAPRGQPLCAGTERRVMPSWGSAMRLLRRLMVAFGRFLLARVQGVARSFTRRLDKEIGETIASALVNIAIAASTPILAMLLNLPAEVGWAGPIVAALRVARPR